MKANVYSGQKSKRLTECFHGALISVLWESSKRQTFRDKSDTATYFLFYIHVVCVSKNIWNVNLKIFMAIIWVSYRKVVFNMKVLWHLLHCIPQPCMAIWWRYSAVAEQNVKSHRSQLYIVKGSLSWGAISEIGWYLCLCVLNI